VRHTGDEQTLPRGCERLAEKSGMSAAAAGTRHDPDMFEG
jgi:hypothetical protein